MSPSAVQTKSFLYHITQRVAEAEVSKFSISARMADDSDSHDSTRCNTDNPLFDTKQQVFDIEQQVFIGIGTNPVMGSTPLTSFLFDNIPALRCLDVQTYPQGYVFGLCDTVRDVDRILKSTRKLYFKDVELMFNRVHTERFGRVPRFLNWRKHWQPLKRCRDTDALEHLHGGRKRQLQVSFHEDNKPSISHHHMHPRGLPWVDDDRSERLQRHWQSEPHPMRETWTVKAEAEDRLQQHWQFQRHWQSGPPTLSKSWEAKGMLSLSQSKCDDCDDDSSDTRVGCGRAVHAMMSQGRSSVHDGRSQGRSMPESEEMQHNNSLLALTDELNILRGKVQVLQKKNKYLEKLVHTCLSEA